MSEAKIVIRGARLVASEGPCDVVIDSSGRIGAVGDFADVSAPTVIDASACLVRPGLVDLRTELGVPGRPDRETIESLTQAAALGGYTAIVPCPFTDPVVDRASVVRDIEVLYADAIVDVIVAGTLTVEGRGESMAPLGEMVDAGVRYFTDRSPLPNSNLLRNIMRYASALPITVGLTADTPSLSEHAQMHEGAVSSRLGLRGTPIEAEEIGVERGLGLARLTGATVHFEALTSPRAVEAVRYAAENDRIRASCDVSVAHLLFSDEAIGDYDTLYKLMPPLRDERTRSGLVAALRDGIIDAIVSGHSPRTSAEKAEPFDLAAPGISSIQVALSSMGGDLNLSAAAVYPMMSAGPAAVAGIDDRYGVPIAVGANANLIIVDTGESWTFDAETNASLCPKSPFVGANQLGRVRYTIRNGDIVVQEGELVR